jgi:hypothetical protein
MIFDRLYRGEKGSSLMEVVVAMGVMGIAGVAISASVIVARPITDKVVSNASSANTFLSQVAQLRTTPFRLCTQENVNLQDNLYQIPGASSETTIQTLILVDSVWVPCTKDLWAKKSYKGVDYTAKMDYISQSSVQKIIISNQKKKGNSIVRVIAKVDSA